MAALVPLLLFALEVLAIVSVGSLLLAVVAATGNKMTAVWTALGIGVIMSLLAFFGSRGGRPQAQSTSGPQRARH